MKIECILQRKGGTAVEMPGKTYHFVPQEDGKHVADVEIEAHIERFLSIPEAYRLLRTSTHDVPAVFAKKEEAATVEQAVPVDLLGSSQHPATFEIEGKTYDLTSIIKRAFEDSGLTPENWNDLPDETRATKIDIVLDAIADGEITLEDAAPEPVKEPTRAELAAQYEAKFGKKPSNRTSIEDIKAKLAE